MLAIFKQLLINLQNFLRGGGIQFRSFENSNLITNTICYQQAKVPKNGSLLFLLCYRCEKMQKDRSMVFWAESCFESLHIARIRKKRIFKNFNYCTRIKTRFTFFKFTEKILKNCIWFNLK